MRDLAERVCFSLCRVLGSMLRSATYSKTRIVARDDALHVRKRRTFYAPLLVRLGEPLVRILDTGVQVLPQTEWEKRERRLYRRLYGFSIRRDTDGTLILPCFAGVPLAHLLEAPELDESVRQRAIGWAVAALAEMHRMGCTHGDAMADNVMIDLATGVARWFDFETLHAPSRPPVWRRADDLRALLATCLIRTAPGRRAETLQLIVDLYADDDVTRALTTSFSSAFQRPLIFHLGQAGLSFRAFQEIDRLLKERLDA